VLVNEEGGLGRPVKMPQRQATTSVGVGQASTGRTVARIDQHEDRHATPGHARRSIMDDGGGQVEPGGDHPDPDGGKPDQIGVHPARRLGLQGGVAGPTRWGSHRAGEAVTMTA